MSHRSLVRTGCAAALAPLAAGVWLPALRADTPPPVHYSVLQRIALGGDGGWDYLTADPAAHRLYISRGDRVDVMDTEKGTLAGHVANTPGVHGIAISRRLGRGFTSNGGDGTVTIFDLKTLNEVGRPKVGDGPDAIIFDTASNRAFTFNGRSSDSTAVDGATGTVAGTIALGGRPEFAVSDGQGHVYVNLEDKSEIVQLDSKALKVLNTWSLAPGDGPSGLAMDRAHRRLFSVCGNGMMVVMDADTGKVVATPAIGKGPDAAGFDPGRQLAFSSNGRDGTLSLVHEDTPDTYTVQTVPTEAGARTMATDNRAHKIYLVTAKFAPPPPDTTPAPAAGAPAAPRRFRRSIVPGSFTVLVVGSTP